jgi:acetyl esterase/lipase
MTIDAPRFQAAALKPGQAARLSQLVVENVSTPASVLAISLDADRCVSRASRVLLIVATRFMQEGAIASEDGEKMLFIDNGPTYTQLMRTGRFRFSLETESKRVPKVYALRMNGTRAFTVPVELRDGRLFFDLDTSAFETATPFFEIVFPTAAPVIRDIPYDSGIGRAGLGTLYLPEKVELSTPLVLCIHGGGWRTGSRSGWSGVAEFFRDELGFAAFNIEYRLAPTNRWPACGDDCVKAAKFVLSDDFKNSYGLSHDKIWICGGSSGGHLALWTLVNLSPDAVAGTVAISAIGDPEPDFRLHPDRYRALFGETVGKAEFAAMNPVLRVKPGMAPLLCTHATQDGVVPIASHRAFVDAYRAAGNRCELFEYGESSVPGIVGHRIWIPDSKPHKLIPEIEGAIRKFVQTKPW